MPMRVSGLMFALLFAAATAGADCIPNGHFTIDRSPFPYTEDLTDNSHDMPIGSHVRVAYFADDRWTKIQTGCIDNAERNVLVAQPANLVFRASLHLSAQAALPAAARYEIQLRLGKSADDPNAIVIATEMRRVGTNIPRSERFGALLKNVPAGSYVYSMWSRILDPPEENALTVDLQWITAQGVPSDFAATRDETGNAAVGNAWTRVGPPLTVNATHQIDASLHAAFDVTGVDGASRMAIAWTLDDETPAEHGIVAVPDLLPDGMTLFDDKRGIVRGSHVIQLWMRTDDGIVTLERVRAEAAGMPYRSLWPVVLPMQHAEATAPVIVTNAGDDVQPGIPSSDCGRWTSILDFTLAPQDGAFSWSLAGYVEIADFDTSGFAQVAIAASHRAMSQDSQGTVDARTDMGMFELQARRGGDGIYFYGDCSKWGNFGAGDRLSLLIRRYSGCAGAPPPGTLTVGRRWLSVKLLPSLAPHLP